MNIDITDQVSFEVEIDENAEDNLVPMIIKCACGAKYGRWDFQLSRYESLYTECQQCHRRLYFVNAIRVFEIVP